MRREFREELDVDVISVAYQARWKMSSLRGAARPRDPAVYHIELADESRFALEILAGAESDGSTCWTKGADRRPRPIAQLGDAMLSADTPTVRRAAAGRAG